MTVQVLKMGVCDCSNEPYRLLEQFGFLSTKGGPARDQRLAPRGWTSPVSQSLPPSLINWRNCGIGGETTAGVRTFAINLFVSGKFAHWCDKGSIELQGPVPGRGRKKRKMCLGEQSKVAFE